MNKIVARVTLWFLTRAPYGALCNSISIAATQSPSARDVRSWKAFASARNVKRMFVSLDLGSGVSESKFHSDARRRAAKDGPATDGSEYEEGQKPLSKRAKSKTEARCSSK